MELSLPLDQMTTSEKLRAIEAIWDDLQRTPEALPSPPWHATVLENRERRIQEGGARFTPWNEAKRAIRERVHEDQDP
jgi:hypothetical protein